MKLTENDWRYLAGLFDGEGCVTVSIVIRKSSTRGGKAGSKIMNLSLRISNDDPRVLLWLEENFGGKVRRHGGAKPNSFVWIAQGDKALEAAKRLAKHSRMKRDQLENFIALQMLRLPASRRGSRNGVTVKEWKQREKLVKVIRMSEYRRKAS